MCSSLPLLIKSRKVVVRDSYQTPCQFRVSNNWFVLIGSRQDKWLVRDNPCQFKLQQMARPNDILSDKNDVTS